MHAPSWIRIAACVLCLAGCRDGVKHAGAWQGVVEFDERDLAFEVGGRVVEVTVDEGDRVTPDQLLARVDDTLAQAAHTSRQFEATAVGAQAELVREGVRAEDISAMEARIQAARTQEAFLEQSLRRHKELAGTPAATPQAVIDELVSKRKIAEAERLALSAQLAAMRHGARAQEISGAEARAQAAATAVGLEQERLRRYELRAPADGTVVEVSLEPGEIAAPGTPVVTVADTRHPYADVFVPQGDLAGIRVGASARVHVDPLPDPLAGRVEYIARRTEFTPRFLFSEKERPNLVVRVRVRIDDPDERLYAGLPAFVYIERAAAARGDLEAP